MEKFHLVYFIITSDKKYVKIGYSKNPELRLLELQTGNPIKLRLLHIINGEYETEKGLHEAFSKYRITGSEWFKNTGRLNSCTKLLTQPKYKELMLDLKSILKYGSELEVRQKFNRYKKRKVSNKFTGAVSRLR